MALLRRDREPVLSGADPARGSAEAPEASTARAVSNLGYALLAAIAREPVTGYALARLVRDPIGFFWETRHSQIYPELARLERAGLVASTSGHGPGPRPKRTYAATDAGLAELRAWIAAPSRFGGRRDELLLKVYASWLVEREVMIELVSAARRHHAAQLELYEGREAKARALGIDRLDRREPRLADYLTLRRGIDFERGRLAWCDWLLERYAAERASSESSFTPSASA